MFRRLFLERDRGPARMQHLHTAGLIIMFSVPGKLSPRFLLMRSPRHLLKFQTTVKSGLIPGESTTGCICAGVKCEGLPHTEW